MTEVLPIPEVSAIALVVTPILYDPSSKDDVVLNPERLIISPFIKLCGFSAYDINVPWFPLG